MIVYKNIGIEKVTDYFLTKGLSPRIGKEIQVLLKERSDEEYVDVIKYLIDYIILDNPAIMVGQTIAYYSWILKFLEAGDNKVSMGEGDLKGEGFYEGVDYAITLFLEQKSICEKYGETPNFPSFSQNIVISKGVYEGVAIDAARYPSPNHMTGWWLITELYDQNIETLMNVHFFHVAFARPEILPFLALPNGYRVYFNKDAVEVAFDERVLGES